MIKKNLMLPPPQHRKPSTNPQTYHKYVDHARLLKRLVGITFTISFVSLKNDKNYPLIPPNHWLYSLMVWVLLHYWVYCTILMHCSFHTKHLLSTSLQQKRG